MLEYSILCIYILAMLVLTVFGLHGVFMVWGHYRLRPRDPECEITVTREHLPMVTVQLPVYNELHVASRLVEAVCALDYPQQRLEIQVLDDSTDQTAELLADIITAKRAEGFMIEHLRRGNREGYKAGALKEGLGVARGEFIAIFDADFLPSPDFLLHSVPHLVADERLGLVQGRWEHLNHDYSLLTRIQAMALDAHFAMEQQIRNRGNYFMNFNGTAGIWRKSCIVDAGDWQSDTLTEDLDLSYRAQLCGWRFLYLNDLAVPAELPAEIHGMKSQQFRWTKGAIETAKKHLRAVWGSEQRFAVKLQSTIHLTANIVFPCILVVALLNIPVVYLKHTRPDLAPFFDFMTMFAVASVSSLLFYLTAQRTLYTDWRRRMLLFPVFMASTMGLAVNNTRAVAEGILGRRSEFTRTPKYNILKKGDSWRGSSYRNAAISFDVIVELLFAIYFLFGVGLSLHFADITALPFQLMFLFGFGLSGLLSLRHAWAGRVVTNRNQWLYPVSYNGPV
jgi:cellulose synthase/poly-beta-1,6-N-acetylglucosamine synthase-like glycosyltransferase